jgi:cyclin C
MLLYPPHLITLACIFMTSFNFDKNISKWFEDLNINLNDVRFQTCRCVHFTSRLQALTPPLACCQISEITKEIFSVYELSGPAWETECRKLIEKVPRPSAKKKK